MKTVTCLKCGLVSMGVTKKHAENEVKNFNKYYDTLTKAEQKNYYGGRKSSIENYKCCSQMKLRPFKEGDCPDGVTLGPVIWESK